MLTRIIKIGGITFGIFLTIAFICRLTGAVQFMKMASNSSFPTMKSGELLFTSNLVKPERFKLMAHYTNDPTFGRQVSILRLVGLPGDTIEIREGELFVNNVAVDDNLTLSKTYLIATDELSKIEDLELNSEIYMQRGFENKDSVYVTLWKEVIAKYKISAKRFVFPKNQKDEQIENLYHEPWNSDNFGPITIPVGKYFTVGDNRHNALDSRYLGLVDEKDLFGMKL